MVQAGPGADLTEEAVLGADMVQAHTGGVLPMHLRDLRAIMERPDAPAAPRCQPLPLLHRRPRRRCRTTARSKRSSGASKSSSRNGSSLQPRRLPPATGARHHPRRVIGQPPPLRRGIGAAPVHPVILENHPPTIGDLLRPFARWGKTSDRSRTSAMRCLACSRSSPGTPCCLRHR